MVALVWPKRRAADMNQTDLTNDDRSMKWTKEQTLMLIDLYQSHSVLWDSTTPNYKNRMKRVEVSSRVAIVVGTGSHKC